MAFQERIADRVAGMVTRPLGPIFQQQLQRTAHTPPEYLDTYDCVLRFRYYRHHVCRGATTPAVACFRDAVVREPDLADAWAGFALLYLDEHFYGYSAEQGPIDAIDARARGRPQGLDIDERGRLANLALAKVRFTTATSRGSSARQINC